MGIKQGPVQENAGAPTTLAKDRASDMTLYTLQLLRFVAAFLVLLFHLHLAPSGYKGVDIFFVISGFVMYYTLFCKSRPRAFHFIVNRFTKIFFLYWVAILLLLLIQPYEISGSIFQTVLLTPGHPSVLGVSWSLSYELYFYFVTGLVVYFVKERFQLRLFFILLLVSSCITILNLSSYTLKGSFLNFLVGANFWEFLLGISCGFLAMSRPKKINAFFSVSAAFVTAICLLAVHVPYNTALSYVVYGPLSFLLVFFLTSFEKERTVNPLAAKLFKVLGDASYGIYLFGPIVAILISETDDTSRFIIIIVTIAWSILFNMLVENRFLYWVRSKLVRRKAAGPQLK
jgi:exopolysaccharide production protein ExoZ